MLTSLEDKDVLLATLGSFNLATTTAMGKRTRQKSNRFVEQNSNFTRASRFFVHFFIGFLYIMLAFFRAF